MEKAKRADKRKYHYIYKTTCLVTNRFYIGMHSTDNLEDEYIGSGTKLWHSINYYGKENHRKEILEFLPSRIALSNREKEIVNEELLNNPQCMNIAYGGGCGWDHVNKSRQNNNRRTTETYKRIGEKISNNWNDEKFRQNHLNRLKNEYKIGQRIPGGCSVGKLRSEMVERAKSVKSIEKRKNTFKNIQHQVGEKNSQYGIKRVGIYKDNIIKKVLLNELQLYLDNGWNLGFKEKKQKIKKHKIKNPKKNWIEIVCKCCMKKFLASKRDIRRNRKFCSIKCSAKTNGNNRK